MTTRPLHASLLAAFAAVFLALPLPARASSSGGAKAAPAGAQAVKQEAPAKAEAKAPPQPAVLDAVIASPLVVIPQSMMIPAPESMRAAFPAGFVPGVGYGLNCAQAQQDGSVILHTLTGRGPTAPGPTVVIGGRDTGTSIFIEPSYNPAIVTMKLSGGQATVIGIVPLKNEQGARQTGLPPAPVIKGATESVPLGLSLERLPNDPFGLDPQGVAWDFKRGVFWIADNYRPALTRVSPRDGGVLSMVVPGEDLEAFLATCRPGWGFTGVSLSPGGKVFTMMRGVLSVNGKPGIFSRIIELDPDTGRLRQIPYPIDEDIFPDPAAVTTGDPVAFADKRLLVLEQGRDRDGKMRSLVYSVDMTRANNISRVVNEAGQPPESLATLAELRKGFALPKKTLILDLQQAGFNEDHAESMTLLADGHTLAFMGGHGFGLEQQIAGYALGPDGKPVLDPRAYIMTPDGKLLCGGKWSNASFGFRPTAVVPRLWVAKLPRKVSDY